MTKKIIGAAFLLAALTTGTHAQTKEADSDSLFAKGENSFTLGLQSSYVNSDIDSERGVTFGIERGLTDNLALGAMGVLNNWGEGSFIDEALAEVKFALPLRLPIKPYAFGHLGYVWDNVETAFAGLGVGAEWSFKRGLGLYGDVAYRVYDSGPADPDGLMFRLGVRLGL
jgi:hypothetical protein